VCKLKGIRLIAACSHFEHACCGVLLEYLAYNNLFLSDLHQQTPMILDNIVGGCIFISFDTGLFPVMIPLKKSKPPRDLLRSGKVEYSETVPPDVRETSRVMCSILSTGTSSEKQSLKKNLNTQVEGTRRYLEKASKYEEYYEMKVGNTKKRVVIKWNVQENRVVIKYYSPSHYGDYIRHGSSTFRAFKGQMDMGDTSELL